jgi:hypothetical protein
VWNYNRTSTTWQQATSFANTSAHAEAGSAVATCGSPYHVLVGAYGMSSFAGGWGLFTSFTNGTTWNTTIPLNVPSGVIGTGVAGSSVAFSHDCLVLVVGATTDNGGSGAVWIYRWNATNSSYSPSGQKVVGPVGDFGVDVAVDHHGAYVAAGASGDGSGSCIVLAYNVTSGLYYQQQKLVASDASGPAYFGSSVALNALGDVLVVGGDGASAFWVWLRDHTSNIWTQYGGMVVPPNQLGGESSVGSAIAISANGGTVAIGASNDGTGVTGAVYIYG